jgi:adenylate cyclase
VKKISYRKVLFILIMSFLYTVTAYLGLFNRIDKWIQDDILLHPQVLTGDVVVIGIDDNSLERLGPYNTWDRNVMASALWKLSEDPSSVPAVVAIDTLYSGTTDPAADANL